jgi:murein DD-endopeptidase MepM/ murein hydrolase activator NlpD
MAMPPANAKGFVSQFRFEFALILMLGNIILGFMLMSDVQSVFTYGSGKHMTPTRVSAEASSQPQISPAPAVPASAPIIASTGGTTWPLKGRITTEFGVPEPPYQPIHTGIDISSARPAGSSAITTFKSGVVAQIITTGGLGNHVVVDHGSGLTSVYGHMSSIAVHPGQTVNPGDTLGFEGRTGVATGPHVHFEIRQNNTPVNPHSYLTGNP